MSSSALAIALAACICGAGPQATRDALPAELRSLGDAEIARIMKMSPLPPLPADPSNRVADNAEAAELGHRLFFETRLSPRGVSCATCHEPERFFTDGKPLAQGVGTARRNAPTVVDAARRRWNGWDGKFDSIWSQALSPLENPVEMGSSRATLVELVRADHDLRSRYERVFGPMNSEVDAVTANLLKCLGAYQRRLASGEAPIDRFVAALAGKQGDLEALSPAARRGLATFVSKGGCYQCHRGPSFTDEEFHALGLAGANGRVPDDPARLAAVEFVQSNPFNAAGAFSDAPDTPKASMVKGLRRSGELFGQFRTAPLRGVELTAPYMHDGRLATLEDVVRFYDTLEGASPVGHHGETVLTPLQLGESGRADLVEFLRALTPKSPDPAWTRNPNTPGPRTEGAPSGR